MDDRGFQRRSKLLRTGMFIGMLTLVSRLLYIQVAEANSLSEMANDGILAERPLKGMRGTIYDASGTQKLAFTGIAYDINIDLDVFRPDKGGEEDPQDYARFLSPLLKMSEADVLTAIQDALSDPKRRGTGLGPKSKSLDSTVKDQIDAVRKEKKFLGITTIPVDVRRYPNGAFASHVLGYFGQNHQKKGVVVEGLNGLEAFYDDVLTGKPGRVQYYTDPAGFPIPTHEPIVKVPAVDGQDLVLTVDATIQHFVEDELDKVVEKYGPKHATIIVADPNNGEILALGNRPHYNPNHYAKSDPESALWDNWALQPFEPGSTFKSFILTAALAEHRIDLNDTFQSGQIKVDGRTVSDWNRKGWGEITYRQGVYNSSNVGFVKIGQKLGKEMTYDYLSRFGFDKKTGIDLPNEGQSYLFDTEKMRDIDLASTSFGQGISVTPIQQVTAMMAIANGGKLYQPHLVKEFRDPKTGETTKEIEPIVRHEIGNEETMSTVRKVLEEAVTTDVNGTGYIKGYHVAGKTGTAEVPKDGGGYEGNKYRLSFIGFAPADKPRLLIYVSVDQPTRNAPDQFGSLVAEPSAKVVLENALRYLQVPIDEQDLGRGKAKPGETPKVEATPATFVHVPDLLGATPEQAQQLADKAKLKLLAVGDGPKVTGQWPEQQYGQVPEGSEVKVYFGPEGSKEGKVKVPDLRGLSLREAMETLTLLRLEINVSGTGYVTKQETAPETLVPFGTAIKLELSPQS